MGFMSKLPLTLRGIFALEIVKNCWRKETQGCIPSESSSRNSIQSSIPNRRLTFGRHCYQVLPLSRHLLCTGSLGHGFFASDARGHDPSYSNARKSTTKEEKSRSTVSFDSTTDASITKERSISSDDSVVDPGDATRKCGVLKYGLPERSEVIRKRRNYVVCYSGVHRIPLWVAECLTSQCLSGPAQSRRSRYRADDSIDVNFSATNGDYRSSSSRSSSSSSIGRSDLSRGHLAAAANNKHDQVSMDETFLLTNILPQERSINSGIWNEIESLARLLTRVFEEVNVISGPLFMPNCVEDQRYFFKYEVIGKSEVVVPTHLFKVILAESNRQRYAALCTDNGDVRDQILLSFVVPNSLIELNSSSEQWKLDDFLTTMEFVERKSGMKFFPQLGNRDLVQIEDLDEIMKTINHMS